MGVSKRTVLVLEDSTSVLVFRLCRLHLPFLLLLLLCIASDLSLLAAWEELTLIVWHAVGCWADQHAWAKVFIDWPTAWDAGQDQNARADIACGWLTA